MYIILWIVLSIAVGAYAQHRGNKFFGGFLFAIILSPLIGFIIVAMQKTHVCPFCKEPIQRNALVCKHCGSKLTVSTK